MLTTLDRIQAVAVAAHGYSRVPCPGMGKALEYAADAATITRRLDFGLAARRLTAEPRRRQAMFARAAEVTGLDAARACEAHMVENLSTAFT